MASLIIVITFSLFILTQNISHVQDFEILSFIFYPVSPNQISISLLADFAESLAWTIFLVGSCPKSPLIYYGKELLGDPPTIFLTFSIIYTPSHTLNYKF